MMLRRLFSMSNQTPRRSCLSSRISRVSFPKRSSSSDSAIGASLDALFGDFLAEEVAFDLGAGHVFGCSRFFNFFGKADGRGRRRLRTCCALGACRRCDHEREPSPGENGCTHGSVLSATGAGVATSSNKTALKRRVTGDMIGE
jgi:hypothetical protein